MDPPVFVVCRDRLLALRQLVAWLEHAGHERIVLVDVESSYEPLLDWLAASPHTVERLDKNLGHRAPWLSGVVATHAAGSPYVVSDCDVVPDEDCPQDAVSHLVQELEANPDLLKVGLSLRIDDLPEEYERADAVRAWESRWSSVELTPTLWAADVDTTFAAYRPGLPYGTRPAARTKAPYVARHLPWYSVGEPAADEQHYLAHARLGDTTWNLGQLPVWLMRELEGRPPARVPGRVESKIRHVVRTRRWR